MISEPLYIEPVVLRETSKFIPHGMKKTLSVTLSDSVRFRLVGEANRRKISTTGLMQELYQSWVDYRYVAYPFIVQAKRLRKTEPTFMLRFAMHMMDHAKLKMEARKRNVNLSIYVSALLDRELPSVEQVASSIYHELSPLEQSAVQGLMIRNKPDAP